jgi:hypothetical protein
VYQTLRFTGIQQQAIPYTNLPLGKGAKAALVTDKLVRLQCTRLVADLVLEKKKNNFSNTKQYNN